MYDRLSKTFLIVLLTTVSSFLSAIDHDLKILALRVDFKADNHEGTTGNGKFILENISNYCENYTVDPPPHDNSYFKSQFKALDNYFRSVSNGQFGIDLEHSDIFPTDSENAYTMTDSMSFYHPFVSDLNEDDIKQLHEERIVQLFSDAINTAYHNDAIRFSLYDLVVIFHAGVSQDFAFDFDTTPEDIPSTYIDYEMIRKYLGNDGIYVGDTDVKFGIILPETQNHILFPEMVESFRDRGIQNICNYQYGLTGTFAMLVGQAIGLPPLWNTETGESGIGVFGLMDQGSNNGQGLIPAPPMAWNNKYLGWEEPLNIIPDETLEINSKPLGNTLRIDIDNDEYFLIENRTNWFRSIVDIDSVRREIYGRTDTIPNIIEVIFDSVGAIRDDNGVVILVPDYDIGLPGSGLLIWHIDESVISNKIQLNSINNDPKYKGIDLEEAGGAQDIGYVSTALFRDPSLGEPYDMWYQGNPEYDEVNSNMKNSLLEFNSMTYPNTNSNSEALSNIRIGDIGNASETMQISISNDLTLHGFPDTSLHILYHVDITGDGIKEIIGGGNKLWWSSTDFIDKKEFYELPSDNNLYVLTNLGEDKNLVTLSDLGDSLRMVWFEFNNEIVVKRDSIIYDISKLTSHLRGSFSNDNVSIVNDAPEILLTNTKTGSNIYARITFEGGILIGDQPLALNNIQFQYISAIDLNLDGEIEILAVDNDGKLYAFNQNYTPATGFPLGIDAISPILSKNIIGDEKPEIVFQNKDGEIIVVNNVGELQYKLANHKDSSLRMLSEYNNRNIIVTESTIWQFDKITDNRGNEWPMYYSDEINSNIIEIDYVKEEIIGNNLIDKKRTYVYPNPARNGKTTIRVQNNSADKINLKIYDSAGYFVDEIQSNIDSNSSVWETEWNVSDIESGVYLIKLTASNDKSEESTILKVGVIH